MAEALAGVKQSSGGEKALAWSVDIAPAAQSVLAHQQRIPHPAGADIGCRQDDFADPLALESGIPRAGVSDRNIRIKVADQWRCASGLPSNGIWILQHLRCERDIEKGNLAGQRVDVNSETAIEKDPSTGPDHSPAISAQVISQTQARAEVVEIRQYVVTSVLAGSIDYTGKASVGEPLVIGGAFARVK